MSGVPQADSDAVHDLSALRTRVRLNSRPSHHVSLVRTVTGHASSPVGPQGHSGPHPAVEGASPGTDGVGPRNRSTGYLARTTPPPLEPVERGFEPRG